MAADLPLEGANPRFPGRVPTVVAVLPRGEAIRNFVYSRALEQLAPEVAVSVASVEPSPEIAHLLRCSFQGYTAIGPVEEDRRVRLARSLLDQAHGRHLWSEAARERWRRRGLEAETALARARRLTWRGAARTFASDRGLATLSRAERALSRRFPPAADPEALAAVQGADLVFNGSHIHSALATPYVGAARWSGVTTSTFLFSWDNLTSQGRILDMYDHFLAWNHDISADLLRIYPGISPDRVHVTGTPQFDFHFHPENCWERDRWAEVVGVDPARPVVLYTTGMPNHMPGEEEIVELVADQLAAMADLGAPQLLVRVYAKDRTGRFDALRARRPDIAFSPVPWLAEWLTPLPADSALWTSTLAHVACGVNVASTVSLELCMFDTPVVNVAFNPRSVPTAQIDYRRYYRFDHYAPVVASGAISLAETADALQHQVRTALSSPGTGQTGRARILEQMFGATLDGQSARRVAAVLRDLVQ